VLTPREQEIAALVAKGMPTKRIAATLGVAERTVKAHIHNAAQRIGGDTSPRHRLTIWFFSLDSDAA
jgi:DNA-binding NarL/FixJ family response regulator